MEMDNLPIQSNYTLIEVPMVEKPMVDAAADYAILHYLRIIFYVFIAIKLIQIVFMRRRKLKISERIQRKFMFAHGIEMIKRFTAEEFELMNLTIQNTLRNAIQSHTPNPKKASPGPKKNVSFIVESNVYYDPPEPKPLVVVDQHAYFDVDNSAMDPKDSDSQELPLILGGQPQPTMIVAGGPDKPC